MHGGNLSGTLGSSYSDVDAGVEADLVSLDFTSESREKTLTFPNKSELQTSSCRGSGSVSKVSWFYVTDQTRLSCTQSGHSLRDPEETERDRTPRDVTKHPR